MAKSRPSGPSKGRRQLPKTSLNSLQVPRRKHRQQQTALSASALLTQATNLLHEGQADIALPLVRRALELFQSQSPQPEASLPALTLLGEIHLELGDPSSAALTFAQAVKIDPDGTVPEDQGGGPEKFFWLAQLCEEGGEESIEWFKRGVNILEREIASLERSVEDGAIQHPKIEQMRKKLAAALCGMVEVWMTDLSLSPNAESACTTLITRALDVSPDASTLQTHASLLISQSNPSKACEALSRSLSLWQDLPPDHPDVPDFSTQISLARLLMEAQMESQAMNILEGLVSSNDASVEAWYLGGWCSLLMAGIGKETDDQMSKAGTAITEVQKVLFVMGLEWLKRGLELYEMQDYQDERLREHAMELVNELDERLGNTRIEGIDEGEDDWERADCVEKESEASDSDVDDGNVRNTKMEPKDEEMYDSP